MKPNERQEPGAGSDGSQSDSDDTSSFDDSRYNPCVKRNCSCCVEGEVKLICFVHLGKDLETAGIHVANLYWHIIYIHMFFTPILSNGEFQKK
jgi:hypothetical protein